MTQGIAPLARAGTRYLILDVNEQLQYGPAGFSSASIGASIDDPGIERSFRPGHS
jgi:hypothetical protein